ncbi:MAG: peptidoglycan editing factor PgeF [Acidovorax sp.]
MFEPDWPAPPGVRALCTTREGGVSAAPFDSLNLGDHVGDDPAAVQANRAALARAVGARPVFLRQVHGTQVVHLGADTSDGTEADACISAQPGVACTIMVADCLPVLLAHRGGRVVAAAHAGWRGLADGVLEAVFERFWPLDQAGQALDATETIAWLGPCIGPRAFEVGPEVRAAFCGRDAGAAACFAAHGGGKYLADLAGLARRRLAQLGVTAVYGNDGSAPWCTVGNAARFFSHRRDTRALGGSGRLAACVWLAS